MRKILLVIALLSMTIMISACGDLGGFIKITNQKEVTDDKIVEASEKSGETKETNKKAEEEEKVSTLTTMDIESVLNHMKIAAQSVKSTVATGTTITQSTANGVLSNEKSEITSKLYFDPFIQHTSINTFSDDGNGSVEMYSTEEVIYLRSSEVDVWMLLEEPFTDGSPLSIFHSAHFDHLIKFKDQFTLSENNQYFIITYSGPQENYSEVANPSLIQMDSFGTIGEMMSEIMEDIEITGTLELIVSKDTFYIVEHNSLVESRTNFMSIEKHIIDENHIKYSDFNTVDSFDVPDEIKNNAMKVPF